MNILLPFPAGGIIIATGICFLLPTAFLLLLFRRRVNPVAAGLSIHVTNGAVAHRALVQQSTAFLDRPPTTMPSAILSRYKHLNINSSPYGPYWRALRRNLASNYLHASRLRLLDASRARVLADLSRALRSGAPAGESLHFAMFTMAAEMCFGVDVVSKLGVTRLRAILEFQRNILLSLRSFGGLMRYPRIGKFLYRSTWRQLLAFRQQQEEAFLPIIAHVRNNRDTAAAVTAAGSFKCYVDSLLDVRIHEDGGRPVTDGELVSLISEFLSAGTDPIASALEWTMANLVKRPDLQQKLRVEVDAAIVCREDRVIQEADLSRMPYLEATVLESLRRHPPVPFALRHVEGDDAAKVLALRSGALHDGATVNFILGKIGRDAAVWSDPTEFTPERFMPGGEGEGVDLRGTKELKMMPFGAGRRACPGLTMAMLHLEFFVANLVKEFEWWEADGDDRVDLAEFPRGFFTFMNRPLRARLVDRAATAAAV